MRTPVVRVNPAVVLPSTACIPGERRGCRGCSPAHIVPKKREGSHNTKRAPARYLSLAQPYYYERGTRAVISSDPHFENY